MGLLFNFDELNAKKDAVIKTVVKEFKRNGIHILDGVPFVSAIKRTSGISYREITFTTTSNEQVIFSIKSTGDIFKVKIGGIGISAKEMPIKEQQDHQKAIKEIADYLIKNHHAIQKRIALATKRMTEKVPKLESTVKSREKQLIARNAELDTQISEADKELAALQDELVGR